MKDYNKNFKRAKDNNIVYRGIRYFIFGEIYLYNEYDNECKFPFVRLQPEEVNPKVKVIKPAHVDKYIDNNLEDLLVDSQKVVLETIDSELQEIIREEKELESKKIYLSTLESDICWQNVEHYL